MHSEHLMNTMGCFLCKYQIMLWLWLSSFPVNVNGLAQDSGNSIANALELPQSWAKLHWNMGPELIIIIWKCLIIIWKCLSISMLSAHIRLDWPQWVKKNREYFTYVAYTFTVLYAFISDIGWSTTYISPRKQSQCSKNQENSDTWFNAIWPQCNDI